MSSSEVDDRRHDAGKDQDVAALEELIRGYRRDDSVAAVDLDQEESRQVAQVRLFDGLSVKWAVLGHTHRGGVFTGSVVELLRGVHSIGKP